MTAERPFIRTFLFLPVKRGSHFERHRRATIHSWSPSLSDLWGAALRSDLPSAPAQKFPIEYPRSLSREEKDRNHRDPCSDSKIPGPENPEYFLPRPFKRGEQNALEIPVRLERDQTGPRPRPDFPAGKIRFRQKNPKRGRIAHLPLYFDVLWRRS